MNWWIYSSFITVSIGLSFMCVIYPDKKKKTTHMEPVMGFWICGAIEAVSY